MQVDTYVRPFPLYDKLRESVMNKIKNGWVCPSREKVAGILDHVTPDVGQQVCLLLIHHFFLTNPQVNPFILENCDRPKIKGNLPFGIKPSAGGKGISVDMSMMTDGMVMLLAEFCSL